MPSGLASIIKDVVFPKQCFGCNAWGLFICTDCRAGLQLAGFQRCAMCQKPSLGGWTHPRCKGRFQPDRLITIFNYQGRVISRLINSAKLALVPEMFVELTEAAGERIEVREPNLWRFVLCPIPQTRSKTRWRGFNQSELIAQTFAAQFGLAVDQLLLKPRKTRQQKELNKLQRSINLKNAFQFVGGSVPREVIIIDDIITTGATFMEAARTLKLAGVKKVWCLAIAQD